MKCPRRHVSDLLAIGIQTRTTAAALVSHPWLKHHPMASFINNTIQHVSSDADLFFTARLLLFSFLFLFLHLRPHLSSGLSHPDPTKTDVVESHAYGWTHQHGHIWPCSRGTTLIPVIQAVWAQFGHFLEDYNSLFVLDLHPWNTASSI